jgi:hypothetical protein
MAQNPVQAMLTGDRCSEACLRNEHDRCDGCGCPCHDEQAET